MHNLFVLYIIKTDFRHFVATTPPKIHKYDFVFFILLFFYKTFSLCTAISSSNLVCRHLETSFPSNSYTLNSIGFIKLNRQFGANIFFLLLQLNLRKKKHTHKKYTQSNADRIVNAIGFVLFDQTKIVHPTQRSVCLCIDLVA